MPTWSCSRRASPDVSRRPPRSNVSVRRGMYTRLTRAHGAQALPELLVRHADDRHLADPGHRRQEVLDLAREHVLTAGDDHVVVAAVDEQPTTGVEMTDVAGGHEPTVT